MSREERYLYRLGTWPLLAGLRMYKRWLSPLLPPACRYMPTCSEYAHEAIQVHGPFRGTWLAGKRLCRCHPWGGHGFDPVPGVTLSDDKKPQFDGACGGDL